MTTTDPQQPTGSSAGGQPGDAAPPEAGLDAAGQRRPRRRRLDGSGEFSGRSVRRPGGQRLQMRRIGSLAVLLPPPRRPAQSLAGCLAQLSDEWKREGHTAAIWQAWPALAGPQLAPHCQPIQLHHGVLWVGAAPGPWLQAIQYNRHQLLGALRAAGFPIRELRFQQMHPSARANAASEDEAAIWSRHPSRIDVHGLAECPDCHCPAPGGELSLWGHCGFCRRAALADQGPPPGAEVGLPPAPGDGADGEGLKPRAAG